MPLEGGYSAVQGTKPLSGAGQATLTAFGLGIPQQRLLRHCGPGRWMRALLKHVSCHFIFLRFAVQSCVAWQACCAAPAGRPPWAWGWGLRALGARGGPEPGQACVRKGKRGMFRYVLHPAGEETGSFRSLKVRQVLAPSWCVSVW